MPLTPDDIAKRSFTPSADGYHQGEVRDFLERVATEHSTVVASMPESQRQVSELTLAIANHEQRLHLLERRLQATLDQLDATAEALQKTQDRASQQLAASRKVTADQRALIERLSTTRAASNLSAPSTVPAATAAELEVRVAAAAAAARPDSATPPPSARARVQPEPEPGPSIAPPARAAAHLSTPAPAELPGSTPPPAVPPGYSPAPVAPKPATPATVPDRAEIPAPPEMPATPTPEPTVGVTSISVDGNTPADGTLDSSPASAAAATEPTPKLLLDDLDKQPLISDNANDLLDNVLDDVMGDLTERPDA